MTCGIMAPNAATLEISVAALPYSGQAMRSRHASTIVFGGMLSWNAPEGLARSERQYGR